MFDKTVTVLGATGSVGRQACDVTASLGARVKMLTARTDSARMAEMARLVRPELCVMESEEAARDLRLLLAGENVKIESGESVYEYLEKSPADVTVHSISGLAGTRAALTASKTKTRIAMANKEAVISAGTLIADNLAKHGGEMIPVDSEHSAIFQCLTTEGAPKLFSRCPRVSRILLTASGGPFFGMSANELAGVTPEAALAHPTWKMGKKITIDCATLMNKGFEVIEASRFFGVSADEIEVVVHRQSIIHSMVEYIDNTVIAQLGAPDMRSAVRYAMTYPERTVSSVEKLDFYKLASITFDSPDRETFPLLDAAYGALRRGGCAPAALIAADVEAVDAFLGGKLSFTGISDAVLDTMSRLRISDTVTVEALAETDAAARETAREYIAQK